MHKIFDQMAFFVLLRKVFFTAAICVALENSFCLAAETATPLADKVPCAVADRQDMQRPDGIVLDGMIGQRVQANAIDRLLLAVDKQRLLNGYTTRPGEQTWQGEHIGKWLHAATLAWVYTGNAELRAKLDTVVAELLKCQLDDGYLGTYESKNRWTEWDVWAHKYNLIGLITYMRYTGDTTPLPACRKMADLLCKEFGDKPGQRDLMQGEHLGMAPGSVLEPMVWLYRFTSEERYRDFCLYILKAFEHPNGPKIVSRLLGEKRVDKVGDAKAYEMLSCLTGMLEWYRTTGERQYLDASLNAWEDIVAKRLYLTGGASVGEIFLDDFNLPNTGQLCETCVTVTWIELNAHLLRLTGEARFAEQLERAIYNQLLGAQRPDGKAWGYYVEMEGKKPYSDSFFGHCCLSSGPRGVALVPTFALTTDAEGVVVNLYDACTANLRLRSGKDVKLELDTRYPADGKIAISVDPPSSGEFAVKFRVPDWCKKATMKINDESVKNLANTVDYVVIKRTWQPGDKIELNFPLEPRVIVGEHANEGKIAIMYGPLVYAADADLMSGANLDEISVDSFDPRALGISVEPAPDKFKTWPAAQMIVLKSAKPQPIRLLPFASAGMLGGPYKVWLSAKDAAP